MKREIKREKDLWNFDGPALFNLLLTRDAEAVDFSAASASALPLPLPQECSYFISSYPTH